MAAKGTPLGIGLAIDFAQLDSDLNKVADHIEDVGKSVSLRVGSLAGLAVKGDISGDQLTAQVQNVGIELARGMSSGVRMSSALMLGFASRINSMLDRFAGAAITTFERLDAFIKGRRWDTLFTRMSIALGQFASGATKRLTPVEMAMKGAFGRPAMIIAKIFDSMFQTMASNVKKAITEAVNTITAELGKVTQKVVPTMGRGMLRGIVTIKKAVDSLTSSIDKLIKQLKFVGQTGQSAGAQAGQGVAQGMLSAMSAMDRANQKTPGMFLTEGKGKGRAIVPKGLGATPQAQQAMIGVKPTFVGPPSSASPHGFVGPPAPSPKGFATNLDLIKQSISWLGRFAAALAAVEQAGNKATSGLRAKLSTVGEVAKRVATLISGITVVGIAAGVVPVGALATLATTLLTVAANAAVAAAGFVSLKAAGLAAMAALTSAIQIAAEGGFGRIVRAVATATGYVLRFATGIAGLKLIMQSLGPAATAMLGRLGTLLNGLVSISQAVGTGILRLGAGIANLGVIGVRGIGRMITFFSTLGSVGKKTYSDLYQSHGVFMGSVYSGAKAIGGFAKGIFNVGTLGAFKKVDGEVKQTKTSVGQATGAVRGFAGSIVKLGAQMTAALGFIGLGFKLVQFFKNGITGAANLEAVAERSQAVFGSFSNQIEFQAENLSRASGVAKGSQMQLATELGSTAVGAGIAAEDAAKLGNELTALAVDATAIGVPFDEAGDAIRSGLAGKALAIKDLAVTIDESTTKAYAYAHGIARTGDELNHQQTMAARAGQVLDGLRYIQGSLAASAGSASVKFQQAGGGIALFAEKIGGMILPALTAGADGFNKLLGAVLNFVEANGPAIGEWVSSAVTAVNDVIEAVTRFGPAVVAYLTDAWEQAKTGPFSFVVTAIEYIANLRDMIIQGLGIAIRYPDKLWEAAQLKAGAFVQNTIAWFGVLPENLGRIFEWLKRNWYNLLVDMVAALKSIGTNLATNAGALFTAINDAIHGRGFNFQWTGLLEGFQATTEQLPEMIKPALIDVSEETQAIFDEIGQMELDRKNAIKSPEQMKHLGAPPGPGEEKPKEVEHKLGGALEVGSKEAFSAISKSMSSGKNTQLDVSKQQLAAHQSTNEKLDKVVKNTEKAAEPKFDEM